MLFDHAAETSRKIVQNHLREVQYRAPPTVARTLRMMCCRTLWLPTTCCSSHSPTATDPAYLFQSATVCI
jgi:hypothetical protein